MDRWQALKLGALALGILVLVGAALSLIATVLGLVWAALTAIGTVLVLLGAVYAAIQGLRWLRGRGGADGRPADSVRADPDGGVVARAVDGHLTEDELDRRLEDALGRPRDDAVDRERERLRESR